MTSARPAPGCTPRYASAACCRYQEAGGLWPIRSKATTTRRRPGSSSTCRAGLVFDSQSALMQESTPVRRGDDRSTLDQRPRRRPGGTGSRSVARRARSLAARTGDRPRTSPTPAGRRPAGTVATQPHRGLRDTVVGIPSRLAGAGCPSVGRSYGPVVGTTPWLGRPAPPRRRSCPTAGVAQPAHHTLVRQIGSIPIRRKPWKSFG